MTDRDELIDQLGRLVAGLQVPVSLGMPLGAAREAWDEVFGSLPGFGWRSAEEVAEELRRRLALDETEGRKT